MCQLKSWGWRNGWQGAAGQGVLGVWCGCSWRTWRVRRRVGSGLVGERLLPLLLRLIKTAPTFLLNQPASQRTKHFYQCLYLGKQWQVGCQGPLWPCCRHTIPSGLHCHSELLPLLWVHTWRKNTHMLIVQKQMQAQMHIDIWNTFLMYMYSQRHTLLPLRVVWSLCCDHRGPTLLTGHWWSKPIKSLGWFPQKHSSTQSFHASHCTSNEHTQTYYTRPWWLRPQGHGPPASRWCYCTVLDRRNTSCHITEA